MRVVRSCVAVTVGCRSCREQCVHYILRHQIFSRRPRGGLISNGTRWDVYPCVSSPTCSYVIYRSNLLFDVRVTGDDGVGRSWGERAAADAAGRGGGLPIRRGSSVSTTRSIDPGPAILRPVGKADVCVCVVVPAGGPPPARHVYRCRLE